MLISPVIDIFLRHNLSLSTIVGYISSSQKGKYWGKYLGGPNCQRWAARQWRVRTSGISPTQASFSSMVHQPSTRKIQNIQLVTSSQFPGSKQIIQNEAASDNSAWRESSSIRQSEKESFHPNKSSYNKNKRPFQSPSLIHNLKASKEMLLRAKRAGSMDLHKNRWSVSQEPVPQSGHLRAGR